jgi:ABC-type sulfate/molybdate transport systems ATPase subunit
MTETSPSLLLDARDARPMGYAAMAGIDCQLSANQRLVLLGPDSALLARYMKMLAGVEPCASGRVVVGGVDSAGLNVATRRELRKRVGYVAQDTRLLSVISGRQNLMLAARYHALDNEKALARRAAGLLDGMPDPQQHDNLPAYMAPRLRCLLKLARALMLEPALLLVENPWYGLDHADRQVVADWLLHVQRERGFALVVSTDDLACSCRADSAVLVCDGQHVERFDDAAALAASASATVRDMFARHNLCVPMKDPKNLSDTRIDGR